jgi:hypothetical protein
MEFVLTLRAVVAKSNAVGGREIYLAATRRRPPDFELKRLTSGIFARGALGYGYLAGGHGPSIEADTPGVRISSPSNT